MRIIKIITKPIFFLIGKFLYSNPTWQHIRKHCFNFPGKDFHAEIYKKSKVLYYLNRAYYYYFEFKYRNLSQREWQKIHWDDYGYSYYSSQKESEHLNKNFINVFEDMIKNTNSVLEIGCGGFVLSKQLAVKYPDKTIYTNDISNESFQIYEKQIKSNFKNIKFKQYSIFDNLKIIKEIPFIYTYNVFMTFDQVDLNDFFNFIKNIDKQVFGILQEPYTENNISDNHQERDYKHNYKLYFKKYGFSLIDFKEFGKDKGIFYFSTN